MTMNAREIEFALAEHFNWRQNLIVPNVSWGFGLRHEADLLILTPSKSLWEVEIKVTPGDLKADIKKRHGHHCDFIRRLYFAFPESMEKYSYLVPERAGIFLATRDKFGDVKLKLSKASIEKRNATKITDEQVMKLYSLAAMRIWNLKHKLIQMQVNK